MDEQKPHTYAYETSTNSEEQYKIKKVELKELREKAKEERALRISGMKEKREARQDRIDNIQLKLDVIKREMSEYNRFGKIAKDRTDILLTIYNLVKGEIATTEELSVEELETELYVPDEE